MRMLLSTLAVTACLSGAALAQSTPTGTASGSTNAAVNAVGNQPSDANASGTINIVTPSALEKGANSFTESQARARIESAGITGVTALHKDQAGIWRGTGMRNGKAIGIGFDYKGNVGVD